LSSAIRQSLTGAMTVSTCENRCTHHHVGTLTIDLGMDRGLGEKVGECLAIEGGLVGRITSLEVKAFPLCATSFLPDPPKDAASNSADTTTTSNTSWGVIADGGYRAAGVLGGTGRR
jgi:hypothetical protein